MIPADSSDDVEKWQKSLLQELDIRRVRVFRVNHLLLVVILDNLLYHPQAPFDIILLFLLSQFPQNVDEVKEVVLDVGKR